MSEIVKVIKRKNSQYYWNSIQYFSILFKYYSEKNSIILITFYGTSLVAQTVKNLLAMQETQIWSLGQKDPREKGIATHSSILAWRISWTEEPGRLQFTGSQRVGYGWATKTVTLSLCSVVYKNIKSPCCLCVWVAQLCATLCDPIDCSPPGSSIHGILQAGILEWVAMSFPRGSSQPRDWTWVSCIAGGFFTVRATREAHCVVHLKLKLSQRTFQ